MKRKEEKKGKNSSHLKAVVGFKIPFIYYFPNKKKKGVMEKNDE
jgi:hypothetical protein